MLAHFSAIILFTFTFNVLALEQETIEVSKKMMKLIKEAKECSIRKSGEKIILCTGTILDAKDISFFKTLNRQRCHKFINQLGYRVYTLGDDEVRKKSLINNSFKQMKEEFEHSTKRAYIDYKLKSVLFKPFSEVGDCIHEVIHFYQHTRKSLSELSPRRRELLLQKFQVQLEREVKVVEKWEKQGNKDKAVREASKLTPFIELQREWLNLSDWLDEKEVYEFVMQYYKEMNLGERNLDIAVSNLVRYEHALSWKVRERVFHYANKLLNKKYSDISVNRNMQFKTEIEYNKLFHDGTLGRDEFEKGVIGLRKKKALIDMDKAKSLKAKLSAQSRGRFFKKQKEQNIIKLSDVSFKIRDNLAFVDLVLPNSKMIPMLIDLGAQESILPIKYIEGINISLIGEKKIQLGDKTSQLSPIVQVSDVIDVDKYKAENLKFALSDSPSFSSFGILGVDFFANSKLTWKWDLKLNKLFPSKTNVSKRGYELITNGLGLFDALEYECDNFKVRLDTGSQVYGDYRDSLEVNNLKKCVMTPDKLLPMKSSELYFSRNVDVNLGLTYLSKHYQEMIFDLQNGKILFIGDNL